MWVFETTLDVTKNILSDSVFIRKKKFGEYLEDCSNGYGSSRIISDGQTKRFQT